MAKCEFLQIGGYNLWNGASAALGHYRSFIGNYLQLIKWYHQWMPTATTRAQNRPLANYGCKQMIRAELNNKYINDCHIVSYGCAQAIVCMQHVRLISLTDGLFVHSIRGGGWLLAVFRHAFSHRWGLGLAQCASPLTLGLVLYIYRAQLSRRVSLAGCQSVALL